MADEEVTEKIKRSFDTLSHQLRIAADYALSHPEEIALNSMRTAAAKAGVQPSTMLRLARELSFPGYGEFRQRFQNWLTGRGNPTLGSRAQALRDRGKRGATSTLVDEMIDADVDNLKKTFANIKPEDLKAARDLIDKSRRVYIVGNRSLFPAAFCFHYTASLLSDKFVLVSGLGGTAADELRSATAKDVLIAFGYRPYTRATIQAVRFAARQQTPIVAVTDSVLSPLARDAAVTLPVANSSPFVFDSIVPAVELGQVLAGLIIAAQKADRLSEALARSEAQLKEFSVYAEE